MSQRKVNLSSAGLTSLFSGGSTGTSPILTQAASNLLAGMSTGTMLQGAQGTHPDDISSNSITVLVLGIDRSGSVKQYEDEIRQSYNDAIKEMKGSKEADNILVSVYSFGQGVTCIHAPLPLSQAHKLDTSNYVADDGYTDLYKCYIEMIGAGVAFFKQLIDESVANRLITAIITDGDNNPYDRDPKWSASNCAIINQPAKGMAEKQINAFIGVGDAANFKAIANQMGITEVLENKARGAGQFRKIFRQLSKSTIQASATKIQASGQGMSSSYFVT